MVGKGHTTDHPNSSAVLYREDLAAVAVQSLLSLDWSTNGVFNVGCTGPASYQKVDSVAREWCVNSDRLKYLMEHL